MSGPVDPHERMTPDERYEVASAAQVAERSNRPAGLVMLAGAVFVVACAFMGVSAAGNARAEKELRRQERELDQIRELAVEHQKLTGQASEQAPGASDLCDRVSDLLTRIERIGERSGLEQAAGSDELALPREDTRTISGAVRRTMLYTVRDSSAENLLKFVRTVPDSVSCTRVYRFELSTFRGTKWELKVGFERWERAQ